MPLLVTPPPITGKLPRREPVAVVWRLPFAGKDSRHAVGNAARVAAEEAARAWQRFESGSSTYAAMRVLLRAPDYMLDPATSGLELRRCAEERGINFDNLVAGAAVHFNAPVIVRRTAPLSDQELELLFEDDQRALDRNA